ncbi:alpha/beta hydrolase [Streptomyces sp. 4503]|uniref:Alpha/beta hydrolase n=1 Tax=Streptomyces niphimycinicus TaxID=2842201 RepID=A0ABS6CNN9_9ACTN|nr:alpha/beta fold hydrolase [Streptomyces niphimycinicus]MBU3868520.1 alpha/beta hydrolase [Streptomyces niphimycinicus]
MAKTPTGDITTHVQELRAGAAGEGEPPVVVLVHGLLTDSLASYYFTLGPALSAAGMDTVMYDLRGHGRTDRPRTGYRLEHFVEDLALLLDALGEHRPVHLVGNSFGGTVAAGFAAWHPDRTATLTMIESEPPVATWATHIADGLAHARRDLVHDQAIEWIKERYGAHTARLSRTAARILETTTLAEDVPAGRLIDDDLSALRCPLLAVFGADSGLSAQVPELEAKVAQCRTVVLPDQGHSVLVEQPGRTRDLVLDWVREHHARRSGAWAGAAG